MSTARWALAGAGLIAGGVLAGVVVGLRRLTPDRLPVSRWRTVTISRPPDVVAPDGAPPAPFEPYTEFIEVRVSDAPGGRGTQLAARVRPGDLARDSPVARMQGDDTRQLIRKLLRESKQLAEVGEVIRLNPKPEGERKSTPGGVLIDLASRRATGEGVL